MVLSGTSPCVNVRRTHSHANVVEGGQPQRINAIQENSARASVSLAPNSQMPERCGIVRIVIASSSPARKQRHDALGNGKNIVVNHAITGLPDENRWGCIGSAAALAARLALQEPTAVPIASSVVYDAIG